MIEELQEELDLTYIFISHDLSVIEHICDRVLIMYLGMSWKLLRLRLFSNPYTLTPKHFYQPYHKSTKQEAGTHVGRKS